MHPTHLSPPPPPPDEGSRANEEVSGEGGNRAGRKSAAGWSDSDSGGRPDSCQAVAACPLPPFPKPPKLPKEPLPGAPDLIPVLLVPGTAAPWKGLKSLPNLGPPQGEGGACPGGRRRSGSRCPVPGMRRGARAGVVSGSARPQAVRCSPGVRFQRRPPRGPARGPGAPPARMRCPAVAAGVRARPRRCPAAQKLRTTRRPADPRRRAVVAAPARPAGCPGRDLPVGLAHLNLDVSRGTGAASAERAFSSAGATAGWGERARREQQQVSLAQAPVPCPGTAVICAPHRTQLCSSPPSRPAFLEAGPFQTGAAPGGARRDGPAPCLASPIPVLVWT